MAVLIENLSYTYPDGRNAIKNINAHFEKGKKTAVGGSAPESRPSFIILTEQFCLKREG